MNTAPIDLPPLPVELVYEPEEDTVIAPFSLDLEEEEEPVLMESPWAIPLPMPLLRGVEEVVVATPSTPPVEIEALIETMTSCMEVMTHSSEQHTTFVLDTPKFASSCLFGTRLTITEFSTAPKAFNVEILAHPEALQLIQAHTPVLLAAVAQGHYPFTLHRFETSLHSKEKRFLKRKRDER